MGSPDKGLLVLGWILSSAKADAIFASLTEDSGEEARRWARSVIGTGAAERGLRSCSVDRKAAAGVCSIDTGQVSRVSP